MGLGGILAAMAQGFGTGVVKNVEQGWKNEELDKTLNWREKEADKQRAFDSEQLDKKHQHDFELEDHKTRNAISETVAKYQAAAKYARSTSGGGNGMKEAQKNLAGAVQVLGVYDAKLDALKEKLASTEDPAQRDIIAKQMDNLSNERSNYLKSPSVISAFKGGEQIGRALFATSDGDMDLYDSKPKEVAKEVKATVSPVAAPARNMVDVNSISPQQAAQIAREKREEVSRQNFARASEEAKEWAAKQGQYKQTFIPRTF